MIDRVLVPLDGSVLAERALPYALEIVRGQGHCLFLVRVSLSQVYTVSPSGDGPLYSEDVLEADRHSAADYLAGVRASLIRPDLAVATEVLSGSVAEALVDYARDNAIDLIVMSTHGRSGLSRWVYGSVTEKVLRGACCPTLIVRGKSAASDVS